MSGHSKWSTIKHKKAATDAVRSQIFSKLSRAISIAVKTGGGIDPDINYKLRVAIDKAKTENMPKENVERAISRGSSSEDLQEAVYEGYGPNGLNVIVEVATDNKNRIGQEIKNLFERGGGSLGGPGSVSFNFVPKGLLVVKKDKDTEKQILDLIDLGIEDVEETEDAIEAYVKPSELSQVRSKVEERGYRVSSAELDQKPNSYQTISNESDAKKALNFLEKLEELDDVQKVSTNLDIPEEVLAKIS